MKNQGRLHTILSVSVFMIFLICWSCETEDKVVVK